jgi:DNA-binding SARP family transcriptional activator
MLFEGASLRARLLGPVTAWSGGRRIDLGPPRQRAVFAALSAHVNQVVSREQLVDDVWGADAPATAVNSVYTYIAGLRSRLEPTRPHRGLSKLLISDGFGYMLKLNPEQVDTHRFEAHLAGARQLTSDGAPHSAIGELEAALALWHGTAYGGVIGPFAEAERIRLAELRLGAMEDRAELSLTLQPHADLVGELVSLVRRHPLRERLRYLLMRCYAGLGRQADALTEYHDLRNRLADELGIEPGDALHQFYTQLLRRSESRRTGYAEVETARSAADATRSPVALAQLARDVPGFTGRATDLRQLHDTVTAAQNRGESAVILLTGGPGVGKTALAVHFARDLSRRFPDGQLQIDLRGFTDRAKPMDCTEALGNLLAALGEWSAPPTDRERQCALYRGLVSGRRMLILLDNAASVEQVRPLLPGTSSCVVLVTSRNQLTGLTVRDGAQRVALDELQEDDAVRLFTRALGRPFDTRLYPAVRRLVAACGGLPLALRVAAARINTAPSIEGMIDEFTECGLISRLDVPGDEDSSVRTVFEWSYRALPDDAAAMFRALGLHPSPRISLAEAAKLVADSPERARRMVDALVDANLVQEPVLDTFRMNTLVFAYARQLATAVDSFLS